MAGKLLADLNITNGTVECTFCPTTFFTVGKPYEVADSYLTDDEGDRHRPSVSRFEVVERETEATDLRKQLCKAAMRVLENENVTAKSIATIATLHNEGKI